MEFLSLSGSDRITIDENTIKIKNLFFREECDWYDIIDYNLTLNPRKKQGKFRIQTKKRHYFFLFLYGYNDFRTFYNMLCEKCPMQKTKVDLPDIDIDSMTKFEFTVFNRTTVILDGGFIRIDRKGFTNAWQRGFVGEKTINISDIVAVRLKKPGALPASIQFVFPGGVETQGGVDASTRDINTIVFSASELPYAMRIKEYVENIISNKASGVRHPDSIADEIRKLKQLLDDGIISQDEFDNMKKKYLA